MNASMNYFWATRQEFIFRRAIFEARKVRVGAAAAVAVAAAAAAEEGDCWVALGHQEVAAAAAAVASFAVWLISQKMQLLPYCHCYCSRPPLRQQGHRTTVSCDWMKLGPLPTLERRRQWRQRGALPLPHSRSTAACCCCWVLDLRQVALPPPLEGIEIHD